RAVFDVELEAGLAALEAELRLLPLHPRALVAHRRRQLALPEISWLEDVVIDRDHERQILRRRSRAVQRHRAPPISLSTKLLLREAKRGGEARSAQMRCSAACVAAAIIRRRAAVWVETRSMLGPQPRHL